VLLGVRYTGVVTAGASAAGGGIILGAIRLTKNCYARWLAWHPGFYSSVDFVVGQKVWATYNVTVLVQIGLSQ